MANEEILKRRELETAQRTQRQEDTTDKQFVFQGQCLILGDSGAGKTSLVKSLTRRTFDPRQPKTQGIEQCLVNHEWQNVGKKDAIFDNLSSFYQSTTVQLLLFGLGEASIRAQDLIQWSFRDIFTLFSIVLSLCIAFFPYLILISLFVLLLYIFSSYFFNYICKKVSSLTMKILDFGGDEDYYAYHHMFLRRQAIYVIVFNMAEFAKNNFEDIDARVKRLQFWFESVCSQVTANTPIFLVGTHRGNTDKTIMAILDGHLRRYLWDTYCDELVLNEDDKFIFFPVENSKGEKDTGIQALQKHIILVAEESKKTIGRDISLSWIKIQDAIITLQEKKAGKFCVMLGNFSAAFENLVCTSWSKETLKYFHEKGLIIYLDRNQDLDLSNWVLLKPEILVDIIIQLVTPSPENTQQRGLRRDWKLLQKKGMLTKPLLKSIISKVQENEEAMTAFLEECDLICPLSNKKVGLCSPREQDEKQPTHFVPSLLPMSAEGDLPVWYDDETDKKFYVFFERFLPEPLFHHLLSLAHKLSTVAFPIGETVLFRDAGKFWLSPSLPYRLKLMKEEKMIEVTCSHRFDDFMQVTQHQAVKTARPSDVLCLVFSMIEYGICRRYFPDIKFHCGPACPSHTCPGHKDEYLTRQLAGVDQDIRLHVYHMLPERRGYRDIFLLCENHSFLQELKEWFPYQELEDVPELQTTERNLGYLIGYVRRRTAAEAADVSLAVRTKPGRSLAEGRRTKLRLR